MIIIVEGIDRVGKTTLVNKLTESCNAKPFIDSYLKFSYLDFDLDSATDRTMIVHGDRNNIVANTEKINSLLNFFEQFHDNIGNVIFDRLHLSEFVYGMVDRNYMSSEAFKNLDKRLAKLNTLIVYVEPIDLEWSSKQHGSNLRNHLNVFEYALKRTECEIIRCNFNTLDEAIIKIKEKVNNDGSC